MKKRGSTYTYDQALAICDKMHNLLPHTISAALRGLRGVARREMQLASQVMKSKR